jgi:hypothetical protein
VLSRQKAARMRRQHAARSTAAGGLSTRGA